jgi:pyrimidine deaminase RibD-like protein
MLISFIGDMIFGQKLRQLRIKKGLTQQQLAEKLGYKTKTNLRPLKVENFLPFLRRAINLAKLCKSEDGKIRPKVGAVIVKNNKLLAEGYRNEDGKGSHAELCAMMKCKGEDLQNAILITTIEPCTIGDHRIGKIRGPCALYIAQFKIAGVIYGILDYNPSIEKSFEQFISS